MRAGKRSYNEPKTMAVKFTGTDVAVAAIYQNWMLFSY